MRIDTDGSLFDQVERLDRDSLILLTTVCMAECRERIGDDNFDAYLEGCRAANRMSRLTPDVSSDGRVQGWGVSRRRRAQMAR